MSARGRSASPPPRDVDVDMDKPSDEKPDAKVVVVTNLTRNVVEAHLQSIFGFYGEVVKINLPTYVKCAYKKDTILFFLPPEEKVSSNELSSSPQPVKIKEKPRWNTWTRPTHAPPRPT
jgi:hypothetical protein